MLLLLICCFYFFYTVLKNVCILNFTLIMLFGVCESHNFLQLMFACNTAQTDIFYLSELFLCSSNNPLPYFSFTHTIEK